MSYFFSRIPKGGSAKNFNPNSNGTGASIIAPAKVKQTAKKKAMNIFNTQTMVSSARVTSPESSQRLALRRFFSLAFGSFPSGGNGSMDLLYHERLNYGI